MCPRLKLQPSLPSLCLLLLYQTVRTQPPPTPQHIADNPQRVSLFSVIRPLLLLLLQKTPPRPLLLRRLGCRLSLELLFSANVKGHGANTTPLLQLPL
jgi:hypothetical protein